MIENCVSLSPRVEEPNSEVKKLINVRTWTTESPVYLSPPVFLHMYYICDWYGYITIALHKISRGHPEKMNAMMKVFADRWTLVHPCIEIHRRTSIMSSSLLFQQYAICIVLLTWMDCEWKVIKTAVLWVVAPRICWKQHTAYLCSFYQAQWFPTDFRPCLSLVFLKFWYHPR